MKKDDLQCVLIGRNVEIYNTLARLVRKIDPDSRFKQVDLTQASITATLKKVSGPSLIFISDEVPFSLELLSDLTWQYSPDSIVIIVTVKTKTVSFKEAFNNTQFSRINLHKNNPEGTSILQFLIQSTRGKAEFRRCKNLLGISEKRCQWLVDSSREAIAFISRDMHWYANTAYLQIFGVSSIQELRSIPLKDVIVSDEHLLFEGYKKNLGKPSDERRSILLSMKKLNGATFRARAYLIPSVFKGHKCHQLWIRELNPLSNTENEILEDTTPPKQVPSAKTNLEDSNPFDYLLAKGSDVAKPIKHSEPQKDIKNDEKSLKPQKYDQKSLLKGVIKRKEAQIISTPLKRLKDTKPADQLHLVSLKVAIAQKKGVDQLLMNLPESFNQQMRAIFWDKVKLSRLLQHLVGKKTLSVNLLLQLNESSVLDSSFIDWLIPGLKRLGHKSNNVTFLIPSNIHFDQYKQTLALIKKLKALNFQIALDSFIINKNTMTLLKYANPDYVRLSLPWVRQIEGNEAKEIKLSSVIRQLESHNIKVIAPCNFSKEMRRLFILSGTSFCQEKTTKTV